MDHSGHNEIKPSCMICTIYTVYTYSDLCYVATAYIMGKQIITLSLKFIFFSLYSVSNWSSKGGLPKCKCNRKSHHSKQHSDTILI